MSVALLSSLKLVCAWTNSWMSSLSVEFSRVRAQWELLWDVVRDASRGAARAGPPNPSTTWLLPETLKHCFFCSFVWGYFKET